MSAPRRRQGGFTLAEMLVALTAAGLLIALLIGLLGSQSAFHLRNEDTIQASQITRALSDGPGAEIRGAGPGDLLVATHDTVSIRVDMLRAVVCRSGSGSIDLFVYDSIAANPQPRWRGTAFSGPYSATWAYADGLTLVSGVSAAAETACRAAGADRANRMPTRWFRRAGGWGRGLAPMPVPGSLARVYGRVTYAIHPSDSEPRTVSIRRNGQEFASPLEPGAAFEYRLSSGAIQADVAPGDLPRVREVRLTGTAIGRNGRAVGRQVVYAISLRN
ncbi:MAG: prepilin-type N-terminal cleavage/methylation domain-containing protein [Gemmatimonadota bacterium]|uniref:prepilin-type N-terminal cleavage/methylation domain-containing protein n=1 Tax=Candidatus Palauibacter scopulicola TaxID=3056741 RepID=UPI0023862B46|nr:prepilin-type N-terminal cleavage/methylation domain-containing protein [Candidatus Palauibacter scopulicola]MDE2663179.1 prepilin-type N-terminal cleavage/methylation domain-containing protein [Candidatus Palauibacter scopulicola]